MNNAGVFEGFRRWPRTEAAYNGAWNLNASC